MVVDIRWPTISSTDPRIRTGPRPGQLAAHQDTRYCPTRSWAVTQRAARRMQLTSSHPNKQRAQDRRIGMGPAGMSNSDSKNGGSQPVEWALERIPADDAGLDFYLREYRPFRLTALQQDPQGMSCRPPAYCHISRRY